MVFGEILREDGQATCATKCWRGSKLFVSFCSSQGGPEGHRCKLSGHEENSGLRLGVRRSKRRGASTFCRPLVCFVRFLNCVGRICRRQVLRRASWQGGRAELLRTLPALAQPHALQQSATKAAEMLHLNRSKPHVQASNSAADRPKKGS